MSIHKCSGVCENFLPLPNDRVRIGWIVKIDLWILRPQEKVRVRIPRAYIDGKWSGAAAGATKEAKDGKDARDGGEPKAA